MKFFKFVSLVFVVVIFASFTFAGVSYIRANQQLIAKVDTDENSVEYYQLDGFNNVRTVFNMTEDKVNYLDIIDYLPFGNDDIIDYNYDLKYKSQWQEWTGNLYGTMDPESGRYIKPTISEVMADTQSLNSYLFARDNPYREFLFEVPNLYSTDAFEVQPSGTKSHGSITGASPTRSSSIQTFSPKGVYKLSGREKYMLAQPIGSTIGNLIYAYLSRDKPEESEELKGEYVKDIENERYLKEVDVGDVDMEADHVSEAGQNSGLKEFMGKFVNNQGEIYTKVFSSIVEINQYAHNTRDSIVTDNGQVRVWRNYGGNPGWAIQAGDKLWSVNIIPWRDR